MLLGCTLACKKENTSPASNVPTVAQKIKKAWSANQVIEGGSVVFEKSNANNIKAGYGQFKLDLSNASSASLKEFDGNTFAGIYELVGEKTLILKNLNPLPTGNNGTIEYTITEVNSSVLKLNRVTSNAKTGGQSISYILE